MTHASSRRPRRRPPCSCRRRRRRARAGADVLPGRRVAARHGRHRPHGVRRRHHRRIQGPHHRRAAERHGAAARPDPGRLEGGPLATTGVIQGMSGSPVYIDGRLVGAVSYALGSFPREPIAGITPIAEMVDAVNGAGPRARSGLPALSPWPADARRGVYAALARWRRGARRAARPPARSGARRRAGLACRPGAGAAADRRGDGVQRLRSRRSIATCVRRCVAGGAGRRRRPARRAPAAPTGRFVRAMRSA